MTFCNFERFSNDTADFLTIKPSDIKFAAFAGGQSYEQMVYASGISPDTFRETTGLGATQGLAGAAKGSDVANKAYGAVQNPTSRQV